VESTIYMRFRLRLSALLFLLFVGLNVFGQNDVSIFGVVRDHDDNKKISGVDIIIFQDDVKFSSLTSNASGKYEFTISFDHLYRIVYSYPNFVTKFLTIDSRYVPSEEKEGGYEMNIDMTLFKEIEGLDVSILDNPIGKAQFDQNEGRMGWDMDYTRQMQSQINAMMKEHDRKLQEEADRMVKMQQKFKELVQQGDDAMRNKKYSDAVDLYTDALVLFPDEEAVKMKKADAEAAVKEQNALVEKEKSYNQFIKTGDTYFGQQEWEKALSSFESAAAIFPKESYPQTRITEINKKLDEIRQNAASEVAVNKLIKEADALVSKNSFDEGIAKYNEALVLIPAHKVTKQQLDIAMDKKAKWLAQQEKETNYTDLIAKADEQFNSNEFKNSITTYNAALGLKPSEKYPKDQIAKAEGLLGKAAAELNKKNEFDEFVRQGDAKVNISAFKEGIDLYKKALVLYPGDPDVKAKIASAEAGLDGLMAAGEINKKYNDLIAKGDKSLGTKDYSAAKDSYTKALALKENEAYPKTKISEIDGILAGLSAQEAALAQKAKQENFDKLVAAGDQMVITQKFDEGISSYEEALVLIPSVKEVEDKISDAKAKKRELMAGKELEGQYNTLISKADRDFSTKSYTNAKKSYQSAYELIEKDYPLQRIAEIDLILLELASKSDKEQKLKDFDRLEKEGDAFVKSNELENGISSYDEALAIIPDEQRVIDKKALAEKKLLAMNANMAADEQYNGLIIKADKAFNEKSYSNSRNLYKSAFALKAEEYPKNRIKEIDRILLSIERKAAEDEAAKLASVKTKKEWKSNTSDEERYIEEAENEREKSDDDNYAELLAYKAAVKKTNQDYAEKGEELRNENAGVIVSEQEHSDRLFRVGEELHERKVRNEKKEQEEFKAWQKNSSEEQMMASRELYSELVTQQEEIRRQNTYKSDRYKDFSKELKAEKEAYQNFTYKKNQEQDQKIKENYYQSQEQAAQQYRNFTEKETLRKQNIDNVKYEKEDKIVFINRNEGIQENKIRNSLNADDQIIQYREQLSANDKMEVKESYEELNIENEMREVESERWKNRADIKRDQANEEARGTDYSGKKDVNDYAQGSLASQYQQGVTEETYEEGTSKVVKRVVVNGNKADEYKMVVNKSGTYYFKNGFSISKTTWKIDTETKERSMD